MVSILDLCESLQYQCPVCDQGHLILNENNKLWCSNCGEFEDTKQIDNCVSCGAPIYDGEKYYRNADKTSKEIMCGGCYNELKHDYY